MAHRTPIPTLFCHDRGLFWRTQSLDGYTRRRPGDDAKWWIRARVCWVHKSRHLYSNLPITRDRRSVAEAPDSQYPRTSERDRREPPTQRFPNTNHPRSSYIKRRRKVDLNLSISRYRFPRTKCKHRGGMTTRS